MFFSTILDKNYISRAHVMIESLKATLQDELSLIYVFALDETVVDYFGKVPGVKPVKISVLESFFPELHEAKENRSYVEYIFTLSPYMPLYVLKNYPEIDRITTLDADMYFFHSPKILINNLGQNGIGITPHSFPNELGHLEKWGKYNVSFQSFPNTQNGLNCLSDWANKCCEYCGDSLDEQGRFADQKYLDTWVDTFENVREFPFPQAGLAPWNCNSKSLCLKWSRGLSANNLPVIFYHFHKLRIRTPNLLTTGLEQYFSSAPARSLQRVYHYYWKLIQQNKYEQVAEFVRDKTQSNENTHTSFHYLLRYPVLLKIHRSVIYFDLRELLQFIQRIKNKIYGILHIT